MRRFDFIPALVLLVSPSAIMADKFINTGPGTVNTCDNGTRVGISVKSTDSLAASMYATLMLGAYGSHPQIGARLQLNKPAANSYARAAFFDNYTGSNDIPVMRVLAGTNAGSEEQLSYWNLENGDFWAKGKIITGSGFWVNSTQLNVPDYVFESGYKLRTLEETEQFVREHSHLGRAIRA